VPTSNYQCKHGGGTISASRSKARVSTSSTLQGANRRISIVTGNTALLSGVAWFGKDIGGRVSPVPDYWDCNSSYDYVLNGIDTVAFLALALTVLGLAELYRSEIGGRDAVIGSVAATGFAAASLANLLENCAGLEALGFVYVVGLMLGIGQVATRRQLLGSRAHEPAQLHRGCPLPSSN
jgi:hypothetical protein